MSVCRYVALSVAMALGFATAVRGSDLAIVDARVYSSPTTAPLEHATILVHDRRISAIGAENSLKVPAGAMVIDGRGKVVTAGFWNSHVHIFTHALLHADQRSDAELDAALDAMLNRWGFTTVFDVESILDNTNLIRARIRAGEVRGPTILTVGEPFFPLNGTPVYIRDFVAAEHVVLPEATSIPQAVAREKSEISRGADGVKLFTGDIVGGKIGVEPMAMPLARALVTEAHLEHRPVFAHPTNLEGLTIALDSAVDILAHCTGEPGDWTPALIGRMNARHMAVIPTLTLFDVDPRKDGATPAVIARYLAQVQGELRAFHDAGGEVLFGTDVGYTDAFDTTEEYLLMAGSGLDWRAILTALTTAPAKRFGYADRKGSLKAGMDADLVVLDADPAADVGAFAKVRDTISGGRIIYALKGSSK
jgi:imidazolonepropionase-like amidohydrolase